MKQIAECKECGAEPINHNIEFTTNAIDLVIVPITAPLDVISNVFLRRMGRTQIIDKASVGILNKLVSWGKVKTATEPDNDDSLATQMLWNEAKARNITMIEYRFPNGKRNVFLARFGSDIRCFEGLPRPRGTASDALSWMDNKAILKKKFTRAGFPVAKGGAVWNEKKAIELFRSLEKPVITKPHVGSGSRHTTIHLNDEPAFLAAYKIARQVSPVVVVEEELSGSVFRATLVMGKLIGVIRRDPPRVIGSGRSKIKTLVEKENTHPLRQGPIFKPLAVGDEAHVELARQGLTWESIPKKGNVVTLNQKVNWSMGGTTEDVTETTHPENKKLFEDIASFLKDPLVGIDFIMQDEKKSWKEMPKCGVIEVNSLPFIDNHHLPFKGEPRNVAGALWDAVFPDSRK